MLDAALLALLETGLGGKNASRHVSIPSTAANEAPLKVTQASFMRVLVTFGPPKAANIRFF